MTDVETEIKLLASPAMLKALHRLPLLAGDEHAARLVTTYFDTADARLHRAKASLRLRSSKGVREQTLKLPNDSPLRRQEWNAPAKGNCPELARFAPEAAADLARLIDGEEFAPFAAVTVRRRTRQISHGGSLIEVAFDVGAIAAAGHDEPICEVELELVKGRLVDALQLALGLPLGPQLRWSVAAKGARAFALAHEEAARPAHAGPVAITRDMSVAASLRTICWNCLDHLLRNYGLLRGHAGNDALHQCRVAIRRLRAALSLYSGSIDPARARHFRDAFRSAATAMGQARELHVLLDALARAGKAGEPDAGLIPELIARRDAAVASAADYLGSADFQRLLFEFASWIEAPDLDCSAAPETLPEFAARVLTHQRKKAKHAGRHLRAMTDGELHQLRIKIKKLRYAVEFFAGLAGPKGAKDAAKYGRLLGKLQDRLGTVHDLSDTAADSPLFADCEPARAALLRGELERRLGPIDGLRKRLVRKAEKTLAKLLARPLWWQAI